ncbi:polyprenyl synthetase family protein [Streptobacillus moniliformis]|uniref:polyprenyl synthetase family protein n=1 Tax=Streptobacillus moniliformis TaxID=34105 RepID=UPI0007EEF4E9|nr:polyprenyl synthetase family protein [Streptobacillus moniliformis]
MEIYLQNIRKDIDKSIRKVLKKHKSIKEIDDMLEYGVLLGGKRIRPSIMYILADVYKKDKKCIENEAVSIELIHAYSLIHDDLPCMDNDNYRRGNLTVHKKYGEANAVLVGDALLTLAFSVLAESEYSNKYSIVALSYYSGHKGMILGQYLDLLNENKADINFDELMEIHLNKTAMLLMASVEIAAISLSINTEARNALRKYILYLGLAYQIQDDILEMESSFEKIGKENTDEKNNKSTFPKILGLEKSKILKEKFTNDAIEIVKGNQKLIDFAYYLLNREY